MEKKMFFRLVFDYLMRDPDSPRRLVQAPWWTIFLNQQW